MDDNKQFWERFSRHYSGFMRRSQATYQQICKAMRPFLKRDMDVLELACGTGQLSVPLSPCVRSWEATDFSAERPKSRCTRPGSISPSRTLPSCPTARRAFRCSRDLQRPPCHASPGKSSGGSLAGSEAGGMAVRPPPLSGAKAEAPDSGSGSWGFQAFGCIMSGLPGS